MRQRFPGLKFNTEDTDPCFAQKSEARNPKSETRFEFLKLEFGICFEFRVSNFEFPRRARVVGKHSNRSEAGG